ncbi:methylenetetrahydrofolate reductase [Specibacter sp. NPDC057265]|uniref:methylenetetrahydrofolate reductase n=1 Tax=Specibacter sp. NPDC057265 TaxID=3346075 RepID=UPI003631D511
MNVHGVPALMPGRVEIIPTQGIVDAVLAQLPRSTTITVTCLPHHGIARTMAVSVQLARSGYTVVPHLAARAIESREQLATIVRQCSAEGIHGVFVVGGDSAQAAGPYASSGQLMLDVAVFSGGSLAMGIAGYPEGHPGIADGLLLESLLSKAGLASYIVTQMCFSADVISSYMARVRGAGIALPVWAGVAGTVPRTKLILLATKIGVGGSLRFISGKGALGLRLLGGGSYDPQSLTAELAALPIPPAGIHHYSFNTLPNVASTPA